MLTEVYPRMYSYLCHLTRNRDHAADLAQEAAIKIWQALPGRGFEREASLVSWVHRVARNVYIDSVRAQRPVVHALAHLRELPAADCDPSDEVVARSEGDAVMAAVSRLPDIYRDVIVLRFLQGLAYREVGAVLGIPLGTVQSRLTKALDLLRRDLVEGEQYSEL